LDGEEIFTCRKHHFYKVNVDTACFWTRQSIGCK
jgi:hypothetical protein